MTTWIGAPCRPRDSGRFHDGFYWESLTDPSAFFHVFFTGNGFMFSGPRRGSLLGFAGVSVNFQHSDQSGCSGSLWLVILIGQEDGNVT